MCSCRWWEGRRGSSGSPTGARAEGMGLSIRMWGEIQWPWSLTFQILLRVWIHLKLNDGIFPL